MNLITGGTGIVGSRLAFDLVKKGGSVRCTKRNGSDKSFIREIFRFYDLEKGEDLFQKIEWIDADLLDIYQLEKALDGIANVYHTAALVSYHKKDRKNLLETNVQGTANLVNVCIGAGIKSFCHLSSVAALGRPNDSGFTDETTKWNKAKIRSNYSLSKYLSEKEVWRGNGEGLKVTIVNPSVILGPAKIHQSSGSLMHLLKKGVSYYPPGTTGFVDVRDVSKVSIALTEQEIYSERFIVNSENLSYHNLLKVAAEIYGNKAPKFKVGKFSLELARLADAVRSSLNGNPAKITSETVKSAVQANLFSSDKIRSKIGVEFIPVKDSLKYYASFFEKLA